MTTGKLMVENFPIGTEFNYKGNLATITGYKYDDATPFAILNIEYSEDNIKAIKAFGLHRPKTLTLSYNKLVELQAD